MEHDLSFACLFVYFYLCHSGISCVLSFSLGSFLLSEESALMFLSEQVLRL